MITIIHDPAYDGFIESYSKKLDLGGFSNLSKNDLAKSSRRDFQYTGIHGELAFFRWRYDSGEQLQLNLDTKLAHYAKTGEGDGGFDDSILYKGEKRLIDIKTSHCENEERIKYLNLIVPQREMHKNMIYVAAFSIGKDRKNVDKVILAGWSLNEDIHKKWTYDNSKWCVPVNDLRDIKELDEYIR